MSIAMQPAVYRGRHIFSDLMSVISSTQVDTILELPCVRAWVALLLSPEPEKVYYVRAYWKVRAYNLIRANRYAHCSVGYIYK
jgi:hypothetical protein